MADDQKPDAQGPRTPMDPRYAVVLPCEPHEFRDFLSGLLGKPQSIARTFPGVFDIGREDIEAFYHLVKQRVDQQNDATILQFTVRIVFEDNSSVLLNSFEDFSHYNEVRPIASVAAHLSWTLLIRFRDKATPEKQDIDVSIVSYGGPPFPVFDEGIVVDRFRSIMAGYISVHIRHTARTWGADIEALLSNHIKTLLKVRGRWWEFIATHNEAIGVATGLLFLVAALAGGVVTTAKVAAAQIAALPSADATVDAKVAYLMQAAATGAWPRFSICFGAYCAVSLVLALTFMIWIGSANLGAEPSFLLLSKQATKRKEQLQRKYSRQWVSASAGFGSAVLASLIANGIFLMLFSK